VGVEGVVAAPAHVHAQAALAHAQVAAGNLST